MVLGHLCTLSIVRRGVSIFQHIHGGETEAPTWRVSKGYRDLTKFANDSWSNSRCSQNKVISGGGEEGAKDI